MPEKKVKSKKKPIVSKLSDTAHASIEDGVLTIRGRDAFRNARIQLTVEDAKCLRDFLNEAL